MSKAQAYGRQIRKVEGIKAKGKRQKAEGRRQKAEGRSVKENGSMV